MPGDIFPGAERVGKYGANVSVYRFIFSGNYKRFKFAS